MQIQDLANILTQDFAAEALSHTDGAVAELNTFLRSKNPTDLSLANDESAVGVAFFLNQSFTNPNVAFMPGLVKAGTARILVMTAQEPNLFKRPDFVLEVGQMISLLRNMIVEIREKVDSAHVITEISHQVRSQPPRVIIDGYAHEESVTDSSGNTVFHQLQFFPAVGLPSDSTDPGAMRAYTQALLARSQGVSDELSYMGIPGFEAILQNWRIAIANPNLYRGVQVPYLRPRFSQLSATLLDCKVLPWQFGAHPESALFCRL